MPCETFEPLLDAYGELSSAERQRTDEHLSTCTACGEYLETLAQLDQSLTAMYRGLAPRRVFNLNSIKQPSALPEILDFCGWAAVIAILAILGIVESERFGITVAIPSYAGLSLAVVAAGAAAMAAGFSRWTSRRS